MANDNNPVGRLYNLLVQVRQQGGNQSSRKAWAAIFQVPESDTGAILLITAQMLVLIKEAKASVEQLTGVNVSLYSRHFGKVEQAFASYNLEAPWVNFVNFFDDVTMQALEFAADQVSFQRPEQVVNPERLAELLTEVNDLLANVLASDIDPLLKDVFVECMEKIRRAILEYRLRGANGLRDALDNSIIIIARHKDVVERDAPGNPIALRFFTLMSNLSSLITIGTPLLQLLAPSLAQHLLPAP